MQPAGLGRAGAPNSRENSPGSARTFFGASGDEVEVPESLSAQARHASLAQRALTAQARRPLSFLLFLLLLSRRQAVGSYVAPGPPEAEGGTARPGAPRARRPAVCPP